MKNTVIILSLCTLIVALPIQAGFKDTFIRALPKVAIGASGYSFVDFYHHQYKGYKFIRQNPSKYGLLPDQARSEWAKRVLDDHGVLDEHDENVYLVTDESENPEDRNWATINDLFIASPTDMNNQGNPIVPLLHEYWHKINQDGLKEILTNGALSATGWFVGALALRKCSWSKAPTTLFDSISQTLIFYNFTQITGSSLQHLAWPYLSRKRERDADKFAIEKIKDPAYLINTAEFCKKKNAQRVESFNNSPWYDKAYTTAYRLLFATHPSPLERAEYFAKAAAELRAKQQGKK